MTDFVYLLTVEQEHNVGGPMGSDYSNTLSVDPYNNLMAAKLGAQKYFRRAASHIDDEGLKWGSLGKGSHGWVAEAESYIFTIEKRMVLV